MVFSWDVTNLRRDAGGRDVSGVSLRQSLSQIEMGARPQHARCFPGRHRWRKYRPEFELKLFIKKKSIVDVHVEQNGKH
jgi:hypothetical protein